MSSGFDVMKIREDFPALNQTVNGKPLVYFDNAATALKPKVVIEAINRHYTMETANVHRGVHFLSEQGTRKYEATREAIRSHLNAAHEQEIIFTKGTTDGINLVAHSFGQRFLKSGDVILVSTMEHHSNIVPWQLVAAKYGAQIAEVPINDAGEIRLDVYEQLLNQHPVKMVAITHISNALGTINPIKQMISMAHKVGAKFLVDAAQSVPHMPVDVQDLDCDFLAFSAHKMYGPTGFGALYGKLDLLNEMPPYQGGGAMIEKVSFKQTTYNQLPEKFEAGTPAIAEAIAFQAIFPYLKNIGLDNIMAHEHALLEYAMEQLSKIPGLRFIGTAKNHASVLSFVIEGAHPHDVGTLLDKQGIAVRTGHHCTQPLMERFGIPASIRASFSFYNTFEEIDRLVLGLNKAMELL